VSEGTLEKDVRFLEARMKQLAVPVVSLPRSLTSLETWGFGFSGLLLWLGTAPAMHAALGPQALWVWLPGTLVGILLNLQVKRLGTHFPDVAGGTPNYMTRLLQRFPVVARYGAIGYLLGWVSVPPMNAIILTDLIKANLEPLGIVCPSLLFRVSFTLLPFIVAFTNGIFAQDREIVEAEQRAFDRQGQDMNHEISPAILPLRDLLIQKGQPLA